MNYKDFTFHDFEKIPRGGKISARRLDFDKRIDSKVFVFSERHSVYQCILESKETLSKLPEVSGLLIKYEGYIESGNEMKQYILLECNTAAYLKQFTEIIKDVIAEFDSGNLTMAVSVKRVIAKWRHFLSEPRSQILNEDDILGLVGELLLLKRFIEAFGADSVTVWKADQGEEDFIGDKAIIEVKSSLKGRHQHVINGIDQLRIAPRFDKYLLSLLFTKSTESNGISLPSLVEEITAMLKPYPADLDAFYQKLKTRGYDIRDSSEYSDYSFVYMQGGYFHVNEDFPKLTVDKLLTPLSPRISKIRYTVDLEGLVIMDFVKSDLKTIYRNGF